MLKIVRIAIILAGLVFSLVWFNKGISAMNNIRQDGETLLLRLRPADPRALLLGDYMALAYNDAVFPKSAAGFAPAGTLILVRGDHDVGQYFRQDDGTDLGPHEVRVKYALKNKRVNYGGARYYFQEGTAKTYEAARYGIFKVSPGGHMILVGLAGEDYNKLSAVADPAVPQSN